MQYLSLIYHDETALEVQQRVRSFGSVLHYQRRGAERRHPSGFQNVGSNEQHRGATHHGVRVPITALVSFRGHCDRCPEVEAHGTGLYERHDPAKGPVDAAEAVQAFLDQEHAFQMRPLTDLQSDPLFTVHAAPDAIARNRRLIAV